MSGGGIHSHEDQIIAMIELAIRNGAPRDIPARVLGWPRYTPAQRTSVAAPCGKNATGLWQGTRRINLRPLLRHGQRQSLGPRPASLRPAHARCKQNFNPAMLALRLQLLINVTKTTNLFRQAL